MVQPVARIRPFQVSDDKDVRFAIGKGSLESLAVANRKSQQNLFPFLFSYKKWEFSAYFHPLTLALWALFSSIFIQLMGWWPDSAHGIFGLLAPLPAFGSTAVPIMFFVDW